MGAERLIFSPVASLSAHEPQRRIAYADAYARTLDALMRLRHDAEARGVTLAVDTGDEAFLTSPLEAARLLDEVNSPAVGWRLDDRVVTRIGHLRDWIETLGGMISCVRLGESVARATKPDTPQSAASLDEIIVALREFAYDGPLIVGDGADPREMFSNVDRAIREALAKE
ncbi:MAG: sugar phosphate isomerase/epimerase [Planctomycetota bacterium]|nr:MAG: sugar phosphate isomerase/epimerase [Planctomycetota bacterium]